ncbi:hypothetical protein [Mycolicibacterium vaccae]|uniref:hypothetical protein n=1 Tax=Mycolicibacterium vaccae TaxID=1810 RepID=UPI003CFDBDE1
MTQPDMTAAAAELRALCETRTAAYQAFNGTKQILPPLVSVDAVLHILRKHGL